VRRKPFSVVLLDEVEKAHPDVFNILLQVMEDGRLSDSQGRVISFKNTMIIMTSNIGSSVIAKGGGSLGFALETDDPANSSYTRMKSMVMEELRGYFKPELLNRLDEVVVFKQLERSEVDQIGTLMLNETAGQLRKKEITLELTAGAMAHLMAAGYDKQYGARPMRRAVTRIVHDNLSEAILSGDLEEGDTAVMYINKETKALCVGVHRTGKARVDYAGMDELPSIAYTTREKTTELADATLA